MADTPLTLRVEPRTIAIARPAALEQSASPPPSRQGETNPALQPRELLVEKDQQADRFIQTVIDSQTQEITLRYPSESQLAFSRAVAAYLRAMAES